jgi:predicted ATPase/DNA-binding SARP family transcriptional activator
MIRLQLLGAPLVEYADVPLTQLKSRKIEALLFYLAATPGLHRRIHLANLLWSEGPEDKALSNLRYALWNLNQVLGKGVIKTDRLTVRFAHGATIWVDVIEFRDHLNLAQADTQAGLVTATRLQQAVDLYRGCFLEGFEVLEAPFFDQWLHQQRTAFHEQAVAALTSLGNSHTVHHRLPEAIAATRRLLELEPWQEAAHRQMMLLLALSGRRDAALEHYQHCQKVLAAELGAEPEAETQRLKERIQAGELALTTVPHPLPAENAAVLLPLFGRHAEYAWLIEQWDVSSHGQSQLVLVRGEAGVGKTRLIEEIGRYALSQGALLLRGRCYEFSGPVPYQPIAAALQKQIARFQAQNLVLSDIWLAELGHLLPEVHEHYPDLPPSVATGQGTDRYRLFEAVAQFLQALTLEQPTLFFVDDLHWADADTLDMLAYLVRRLTTSPLLIIGAYRPGEVLHDHAMVALHRPLSGQTRDKELHLTQLSLEAVYQIVQAITPVAELDTLALFLHQVSQGNPFIVFETLGEMQERGWLQLTTEKQWLFQSQGCLIGPKLSYDAKLHVLCSPDAPCQSKSLRFETIKQLTVPVALPEQESLILGGVQTRIRRRVARLSVESRRLLSLAAVIGRPFEAKLLQAASGAAAEFVLDCLDNWLARGLIREGATQSQRAVEADVLPNLGTCYYDFSHDLIRAVVYNDLSQARRQMLHLQLGTALEQLYAEQMEKIIKWLAHHYHCGCEPHKALVYLQQAGQQAQAVYALPIALERYQQALTYWERLYNPTDTIIPTEAWRQRWDLLLNQAEVVRMLGYVAEPQLAWETVVQEVTYWGDDRDLLRVIEHQSARLEYSADLDQRRQLAKEGLRLARLLEDPLAEGNFLQAWADCNRDMANYHQAIAQYEEALIAFSSLKQARKTAFCLIGLGNIHLIHNRFGQALSYFEQAGSYAQADGYQDAIIWSLNSIAHMYLLLGDLESAQSFSQEALDLCQLTGFDSGASAGLVIQGYLDMLRDNLTQAQVQFERAWVITKEMGQSLRMADVQCGLGHLCLLRREAGRALVHFRQAESLCGNFYYGRAIEARSYRAMAHLALGQLPEAVNCSHHAVVWLIGREQAMYAPQRVYWNQYQVLLAEGEIEEAQEALVKAHRVVATQLESIAEAYPITTDPDLVKAQFLTRLPWNQDIVGVWETLPLSSSVAVLHLLHGYPG